MADFAFEEILTTLEHHQVRYVVIGAVAAIAHGSPLPTEDIDITPARDVENLDRLAAALRELDARLHSPTDPDGVPFPIEAQFLGQVDSWTLTTRHGDLDLLFMPAGTGGYDDLRRAAVVVDLGQTDAAMADLSDIIRMKEAAGRPKDLAQLPALRQTLELRRERGQ